MSRANESAFPQPADGHSMNGLTIREEFAKAIAAGMCAAEGENLWADDKLVSRAVKRADLLIAELSKAKP